MNEGMVLFNLGVNFYESGVQPVKKITKEFIQSNLEKLTQIFGINKKVPEEVLSNFYTAIGYYPELKKVNIKVRYGKKQLCSAVHAGIFFFIKSKTVRM